MATAGQDDKGTELVAFKGFAVATAGASFLDTLRENVGSGGLGVFDLDRVRIPAGGGRSWEVPTLEGAAEDVRELEGIVVQWSEPRAWWRATIDESGGGSPPDCTSDDGVVGRGDFGRDSTENPTGLCVNCPNSQWGSDRKGGRGQDCKQMRLLFLLRPDSLLPLAIFLPPTSIRPVARYFLRLASKGTPYYAVVTRIALEQAENRQAIKYSRAAPSLAARLSPADVRAVQDYADAVRHLLESVALTEEDVADLRTSGSDEA